MQGSGRDRVSKPSVDTKRNKSPKKQRSQKLGRWAEGLVRWYLRATGRRIVATNCKTPVGEIDIIAKRGNLLSFIEVKARGDEASAAHAISQHQQRRIERAAAYFLTQNPALQSCDVRFDVALVYGPLRLRYMADAWRP